MTFPTPSSLRSFFLNAVLVCGIVSSVSFASAETTIVVSEDTLINSTDAINYNISYFDTLATETGPASIGGYWGSWMKFDLRSLGGQAVSSAYLDLTSNFNHSATALNHEVFSSTNDSWSASTITGQNQPGAATLASQDVQTIPDVNAVYTWNVTNAVNNVGTTDGFLSLFIRPTVFPADDDYRGPHFYSLETGISPPVLRVTLVPEPSPIILLLGGGIAMLALVTKRRFRRV